MIEEQAWLVGVDVIWVIATMGVLYLASPRTGNALEFVHTVWWYPFVFALVGYAARASWTLGRAGVEGRWRGRCAESEVFLRLYVAAQIVAIPVECAQPQPVAKKLQMVGHHAVSIATYAIGLATGQMHFYGTAAGLSEVSTIFLEGILLSKHPLLEPHFAKYAPWYLPLNGAGLWLSFIVFRLALFPALVALFLFDVATEPDKTWRTATPWLKYTTLPSYLLLFLLSASWFSRIHAGFVAKVLKRPPPDHKAN